MGRTVAVVPVVGLLLTCCGEGTDPSSRSGAPAGAAHAPSTSTPVTTSTSTSVPASATTLPPPDPVGDVPGAPGRDVEIPEGPAPVVDGTIEPGEWAEAVGTALDDGTGVRWMHAGGSLYVGIDGDEVGAVNLVLAGGDEVRMLHSSAALGSAVYVRENGARRMECGFEWCCRSRTDGTDAVALFESEGWTANIGFLGAPGDVEFRVSWSGGEDRAAISSIAPDGAVSFRPADLGDEARAALHGERQEREQFAVETRPRIVPSG